MRNTPPSTPTIEVVDWESHQHYKSKAGPPLWIKLYRDILSNYHIAEEMTDHHRWVLVGIWCLAARHENEVPGKLSYLSRHLSTNVTDADLDLLEGFGFIVRRGKKQTGLEGGSRASLDSEEKRREEKRREEGRARGVENSTDGVDGGSSGSDGSSLDLPAPALAALAGLKHPANRTATERTLMARFLDPDDDSAMLDKSVRGASHKLRREIVAAALVEYGDQATEWKAQRFAAFVRKCRSRPKEGTEAARVATKPEPGAGYRPLPAYREDEPRELARIDARSLLGANGIKAPTGADAP